MQYPRLKNNSISAQEKIFKEAIEVVISATLELPDGDLRLRAVKEIMWDKTKTYEGVGRELNYEWRTIQNWVNRFVNMVGKAAGF